MTYVNHGIGGTTVAVRTDRTNSFVERIETYSKDVDYVIVMGGANDTVSGTLGEITTGYSSTLDKTTFCGAWEWLCKYVMENYSDKKYGFIVPFHIASAKLSGEWGDAIVAVCKKWGMPCLDLRCEAGFNLQNVDLRKIYGAYVGNVAAYNPTKGYVLDEQVKYEGVLYKADTVIPAPAGDFDASKWTRLQSDGASDYDDWHCNVLGYKKLADVVEAWLRTL
jgi:lysophospholipase L1-like esterase